jgi:VanZ family protein
VTIQTGLRILAWLLLAGLIYVTLSPIDLRPSTPLPTQVERIIALAIVGFAFAIAYPRHIVLVAAVVLGATVMLEALQLLSPSRHGRLVDVAAKLIGAGAGIGTGWLLAKAWRKRSNR